MYVVTDLHEDDNVVNLIAIMNWIDMIHKELINFNLFFSELINIRKQRNQNNHLQYKFMNQELIISDSTTTIYFFHLYIPFVENNKNSL